MDVAEIARVARRTRRKPSRALWIAAALVGVACSLGFVTILLSDASDASSAPSATPAATDHGLGFTAGIVVGLIGGIGVGFAAARHRHSSRSKP